ILAKNEGWVRAWWVDEQSAGREPSTSGAYAALMAAGRQSSAPPDAAIATPVANDFPGSERRARIEKTLAHVFARGDRAVRLANADEQEHRAWEDEQRDQLLDVIAPHVHPDYDRDDTANVVDEMLAVIRGE